MLTTKDSNSCCPSLRIEQRAGLSPAIHSFPQGYRPSVAMLSGGKLNHSPSLWPPLCDQRSYTSTGSARASSESSREISPPFTTSAHKYHDQRPSHSHLFLFILTNPISLQTMSPYETCHFQNGLSLTLKGDLEAESGYGHDPDSAAFSDDDDAESVEEDPISYPDEELPLACPETAATWSHTCGRCGYPDFRKREVARSPETTEISVMLAYSATRLPMRSVRSYHAVREVNLAINPRSPPPSGFLIVPRPTVISASRRYSSEDQPMARSPPFGQNHSLRRNSSGTKSRIATRSQKIFGQSMTSQATTYAGNWWEKHGPMSDDERSMQQEAQAIFDGSKAPLY